MRKNVLSMLMAFVALFVGSTDVFSQIDLGNILGNLAGSRNKTETTSLSSTSGLLSGLTSIFSKDKQATKDNIVGTWEYSEPAIVFESDNLLTKAGASLASDKIETKLQEQLSKSGIESGAFSVTFNEDGTFSETFNSRTIRGKWKVEDSKLNLVFGNKSIPVNTQLTGNKLMFVTDATKLLDLVKTIASKSSNGSLQTVTSLMQSVDGLQAGLTLVKKQ